MNNWKEIGTLGVLVYTMVLSGCTTAGASSGEVVDTTPSVTEAEALGTRSNARVNSLETELKERDQRITDLQSQLQGQGQLAETALFPPNAKAGQCYARVLTPEKYRNWEEKILVKEESDSVEITPARYELVEERVLVKEESVRFDVVPADYEMVSERIVVTPASTKIVEVPATFRTVSERVLDKPAYTVWKRGAASTFADPVLSKSVSATGEVMCLVEVPATYKTITRSVVDVAAHTKEIKVPAEYKTVEKRVVKRPASTREVVIPAEYETVSVRNLVSPAEERRNKVPPQYGTVQKSEKISDATLAWQQVLCDVNATSGTVLALQQALKAKGYSVGPIDGVLGSQTISAVSSFAKREGIPHGANYVPIDVLKALSLKI